MSSIPEKSKITIKEVTGYLRMRGIPKPMIDQIRNALIYDSVTESNNIKADRIFAACALAARRAYGFGPERIMRLLREFDHVMGAVGEMEDRDWTDVMEELREETGIIVRTGGDDRLIVEVLTDDEKIHGRRGRSSSPEGND